MSNGNIRGSNVSYAPLEKQMAAYDALPRSVRAALQNAVFDWAPYPLRRRFERSANPSAAKTIVKAIAKWDRDQIAKDRKAVWGIGRAPVPLKPYVSMKRRAIEARG